MKYSMYLDDERSPKTKPPVGEDWIICKGSLEALYEFSTRGYPTHVSFDHDLGDNSHNGYELAKRLVKLDMESHGTLLPEDFTYNVHSANPVGRDNIIGLLDGYFKFKQQGE